MNHLLLSYLLTGDTLFSKTAARAGVQRLRDLYQQLGRAGQQAEQHNLLGRIGALEQQAGNVLAGRHVPRGSQLRVLGAGGEGVAQHVLMPGAGGTARMGVDPLAQRAAGSFATTQGARGAVQAARSVPAGGSGQALGGGSSKVVKTYDPTSPIYNPAIQAKRQQLVGAPMPGYAQTHAMAETPHRVGGHQTEYAINEYIPGQAPRRSNPQDVSAVNALKAQARNVVPGHEMVDVRGANMVRDMRDGQMKVIDSMPVPLEHTTNPATRDMDYEHVLDTHINMASPTGKQFNTIQSMLGKDAPIPLRNRITPYALVEAQVAHQYGELNPAQQSQLEKENRGLDRHYAGQVLGQAYGGRQPVEYRMRSNPMTNQNKAATPPQVQPHVAPVETAATAAHRPVGRPFGLRTTVIR